MPCAMLIKSMKLFMLNRRPPRPWRGSLASSWLPEAPLLSAGPRHEAAREEIQGSQKGRGGDKGQRSFLTMAAASAEASF